ncbi:MAG: hypothetical protein R2728_09750 [Chitinophagales bacterium]
MHGKVSLMKESHTEIDKINEEEIEKCISILEKLVEDTNQIFEFQKTDG